MKQAAALRARVYLARGDIQAATAWAADCGLDPGGPGANHPGLQEVEYLTLTRVLTAQGRFNEAILLLERLLESSLVEERYGSAIENLTLQSLVFQARGDHPRSLEYLERALSLAEPEGFVRTFVDEGEPMRSLILNFQSKVKTQIKYGVDDQSLRQLKYTDTLLAAFPMTSHQNGSRPTNLFEPLSERELDILRLIATGRTNQEIADILVIALSTVKSHINNLYGKLGANRRTEAIAIARDLSLFSE
jgi:LuxR family maltose regulon positive regulatory protein